MDALWLDIPEEILEERRRLGHDKKDECWDGVIHMVPPPSAIHDRFTLDLAVALDAIAKRRGWRAWTAGVYEPDTDKSWRVPDISLARPEQVSTRGLEGAELAVEVLSPHDESRKKFGFYARVGVRELWLIDPATRATELYALVGDRYEPVAGVAGVARSPLLGITLELVEGPRLRLRDGDDVADV